jgi:hypothetical protein
MLKAESLEVYNAREKNGIEQCPKFRKVILGNEA